MVMCWAPGCNHYNHRHTCKFFRFPKEEKLRMKWKQLVRRDIEPGPGAFLCSCHFPEGKKENLPKFFVHNEQKRFTFLSPERKKRKPKAVETTVTSGALETAELLNLQERVAQQTAVSTDSEAVPSTSYAPGPSTSSSAAEIEVENYFLRQQVAKQEIDLQGGEFSFKLIEGNDKLCKLYTGIPTTAVFLALYGLLENIPINYYLKWNVEKITKLDQLLMCLMKLRQNYPHADLSVRFKVSQATVTNIVITWVHVLHEILYKQLMKNIPTKEKNQTCLPNCFSTFTNCRIVLDCTEMAMTVPRSSMLFQKTTYSSYKHKNTWKALVGVAPNGVITYISTLYPGGTSDKKIVQHCGVLNELKAGDLILADKGFLLKDLLPPGVHLNIPPFLENTQFTPAQVRQTESIARARIHVERAIQRMKLYKILSFIPRSLFEHAGVIVQVIGALTNLHYPLLQEVKQGYSSSESE